MTFPPLRVVASYALVALLLLAGATPLLAPTPAHAAVTRTIELTANGPKPVSLTAAVGDTIVFKNTDATFIHQVDEASTNWAFDCGPLAPQQICNAGKLAKPGEYLFEGVNLDSFKGKVVVPAAPSPAASPRTSSAPAPAASSPSPASSPASSPADSPAGSSPAPAPESTGGSGTAGGPLIGGGFGSGGVPLASASPGGPAPDVAPVLPGSEDGAASPSADEPGVITALGRLPEPATARRYGLPAALAAVGVAGVGSLLVRLLLAHPAARARRREGGGPPVAVD